MYLLLLPPLPLPTAPSLPALPLEALFSPLCNAAWDEWCDEEDKEEKQGGRQGGRERKRKRVCSKDERVLVPLIINNYLQVLLIFT